MRVLRVCAYFAPAWIYGGPARSILESCQGLAELGEQVRVLTTTANGDAELDAPIGAPVETEGVETWYYPRSYPRSAFHSPALYRAVREQVADFDVVQVHATLLPLGVVACRAAERAGVPYLVTPHGALDPWALRRKALKKALFLRLWERANLVRADAVVVLTEDEKRQVLRLAPGCRAVVAPNGQAPPDLDATPPRSMISEALPSLGARPYVLFLGRLSPKKGLDLLIPAFAHAARAHPDWLLVVAGPDEGGMRLQVERLSRRHGISERVLLTGMVNGAIKTALIGHAGAFCLPSYSEGLPTAVIEAMMLERPVVLSRQCHMPEVGERGAGWVVDTSIEQVAAGLAEAMDLPDEREARGARGRALALERFSRDAAARRLRDLYRSCIEARAARSQAART